MNFRFAKSRKRISENTTEGSSQNNLISIQDAIIEMSNQLFCYEIELKDIEKSRTTDNTSLSEKNILTFRHEIVSQKLEYTQKKQYLFKILFSIGYQNIPTYFTSTEAKQEVFNEIAQMLQKSILDQQTETHLISEWIASVDSAIFKSALEKQSLSNEDVFEFTDFEPKSKVDIPEVQNPSNKYNPPSEMNPSIKLSNQVDADTFH